MKVQKICGPFEVEACTNWSYWEFFQLLHSAVINRGQYQNHIEKQCLDLYL